MKIRTLKACITGGHALERVHATIPDPIVRASRLQHAGTATISNGYDPPPSPRLSIHRIAEHDSPYVVAGGVADHVHLLFELPKDRPPTEVVAVVKRESSKFVKTLEPGLDVFQWQRGYGMFAVSPSNRAKVEAYVRNQVEHHRQRSFQEEYRAMLKRMGMDFDERYVWD